MEERERNDNDVMLNNAQDPIVEEHQEEDDDAYARDPSLLATKPIPKKMFAFDWANGLVSPFRPCPESIIEHAFHFLLSIDSLTLRNARIIDVGCGKGDLLFSLEELCRNKDEDLNLKLSGIELDKELVKQALQRTSSKPITFYIGDFTENNNFELASLSADSDLILQPSQLNFETMLQNTDIIFFYLLPEAFRKMIPTLFTQITRGKTIVSIEWTISGLDEFAYEEAETSKYRFYVYKKR